MIATTFPTSAVAAAVSTDVVPSDFGVTTDPIEPTDANATG
jgi:hypothetical protein